MAQRERSEYVLSIRCHIKEELEVLSSPEVVTVDKYLCKKVNFVMDVQRGRSRTSTVLSHLLVVTSIMALHSRLTPADEPEMPS